MSKGTAVLQFEIDRKRWLGTNPNDMQSKYSGETPSDRLYYIARTAISDTISNGGTFILVASKDKITMVQRTDAEDFDEAPKRGQHVDGGTKIEKVR